MTGSNCKIHFSHIQTRTTFQLYNTFFLMWLNTVDLYSITIWLIWNFSRWVFSIGLFWVFFMPFLYTGVYYFYPIPHHTHFECFSREIFTQEESALPLVQLSISFLIVCFEKHNFYFLLFKQPILNLIDNCTSLSAPSPCINSIGAKKTFWEQQQVNWDY